MRRCARSSAGLVLFVATVALVLPAAAKDVRIEPHVSPPAEAPFTPEESAALERALNFDGLALASNAPARSFSTPTLTHPKDLALSRSDNADGSSTLTVAQPLSDDGNAKVGADVGLAGAPATTYEPGQPWPGATKSSDAGSAWASLGLTRYASVDAHVDPGSEQGRLGATVQHSIPLGSDMSVTLRGHYTVSDTLAAAPNETSPPVVSNDQAVKLNIASTGTTLSAGVSASNIDPVPHTTLSADQDIYGPLHVTTAITDAGQPTSNKSVTAGFKLDW